MDAQSARVILADVFSGSPFLSNLLTSHPDWLSWLIGQVEDPRSKSRDTFIREAREAPSLHRFHRRELLRIGARDLTCRFDVRDTTRELSWLADATIQRALGETEVRFAVIGVGKLGGEELNFRSDIDLIYVFDGDDIDAAARLARRLTHVLTEHTGEGALYRVDLRLRPEGARGAIACSLRALQTYYDSWAETFERMALIKARVVAGDEGVGERFMSIIEPFVYRKYLDFAAIDEVRDIKLRIDQKVDSERNIKLGRGGIREIEFFVQALQVLYGGERQELRVGGTLDALDRLAAAGLTEKDDLRDAYVFLRNVEHKLQIAQGLQTHELPSDRLELAKCAARMKLTPAEFETALARHRGVVSQMFRDLFAEKSRIDDVHRFVNHQMSDAAAREWLTPLRLDKSLHIFSELRDAPSFGHSPSRMRNLLENVLTPFIANASQMADPDRVLTGLARLLESVGAREAFYSSLLENPRSIARLSRILSLSNYLSDLLFALPELLDFVVDDERIETPILQPVASDDRRIQEFCTGAQYLLGVVSRRRATRVLTRFAERAIRARVSEDERIAVFALGRFGERDINLRSDLDLIVAFEGEHGPAIAAVEKLIAGLPQFRLDLRLRPDGNKGSTIFRPEFYREYLQTRAETWERMALTKARFVAGDRTIGWKVQHAIDEFVYERPFGEKEEEEMRAIRYRMEHELAREKDDAFDLKLGRGGCVDVEFLCQMEQIRRNFRVPSTIAVLKRFRRHDDLLQAYEFLRSAEFMLRLQSSVATTRFETRDAGGLSQMLGVTDFLNAYRNATNTIRRRWDVLP